jgi:uncharacterized membrane protein
VDSLRRARLAALLVATAIVLGVLHGLLLLAVGDSSFLLTWWGTTLRALVAVVVCFATAGTLERRWSTRGNDSRILEH